VKGWDPDGSAGAAGKQRRFPAINYGDPEWIYAALYVLHY
jgi:hypothetical protein